MDRLLARVRRTVRRFALMSDGTRVLAAVSGGADSVALAHVLLALEEEGICRLAGLAHLNHGLRGAAAERDAAFCERLAADLGRAFVSERVDVAALAEARKVSLETAGHLARYDFFERAAADVGATRVALGHTRDDQAETFLLRLMRGAGPSGLGAMHPANGLIVRPLLDCSRREVRRFVADRGLEFCEDESNADRSLARNRVRHDLLPQLLTLQPSIVKVLSREATIAREDAAFLHELAAAAFARLAVNDGHGTEGASSLSIDVRGLLAEPPAIARRVVWMGLASASGGRFVGFDHVEAVLELARRPAGEAAVIHLPGQLVSRRGDEIVLTRRLVVRGERRLDGVAPRGPAGAPDGSTATLFRFSLSIPGEVSSPLGWTISAEPVADWTPTGQVFPRSWAVLDARALPDRCVVRNWQPGDRIRLLGGTGTRKLQDLFVDRKVPRAARAVVPVVVGPDDRVIWVAGYATSGDFAVTGGARDVVILKLRHWSNGT